MRIDLHASRAQQAERATDAGCAVVFAQFGLLSATYALDSASLARLGSVARDAAAGLGLPFDAALHLFPDQAGLLRAFDVNQVQMLYKALRDYLAAIQYFAAWMVPDLPAQPVVIA